MLPDKNERPKQIFDSRSAKSTYSDHSYYRTSSFDVPPGYIAVVELTTHKDYYEKVTFSAIRVPAGYSQQECIKSTGLGKRYRRWKCSQHLGSKDSANGLTSLFTPYNKSAVRWGWDPLNKEIVEFEYVTRPGRYYLMADKCENVSLEDCDNPTILEVSFIPVDHIPELALPCCTPCDS